MIEGPFRGVKLILFLGGALLVLRRDPNPRIPWPGRLDFPGGLIDPGETPLEAVLRETREETGLVLAPESLRVICRHAAAAGPDVFYAAHEPLARIRALRMGDEGTGWAIMRPETYATGPNTIPHFAEVLRVYLELGPE
ncbi:NUDIX domain-containing protein [Litorisediminicola beolgyonensis]|uniref:NUDIX domain-containing protein n=1 Tax=Litorisediminicola beolgyonensis TaxID=1173614 RepID=A0ABW3ZEP1_9RHOB